MKKAAFITILMTLLIVNVSFPQWTWVSPYPTGYYLTDVSSPDGSNYWIVGEQGLILKYNNGQVQQYFITDKQNLNSIDFYSASLGWIVGDDGIILKFDGQDWIREVSPTSTSLKSVYIWNEYVAYAAGDSGLVLKYSGGQWNPMTAPYTTLPLLSISADNQDNIEAIGYSWGVGIGTTVNESYQNGTWEQSFWNNWVFDVLFKNGLHSRIGGRSDESLYGGAVIYHRIAPDTVYHKEFYHSFAGGQNYQVITDIYMYDDGNGWAAEQWGATEQHLLWDPPSFAINRYQNGAWQQAHADTSYEISALFPGNQNNCLGVGPGGQVLEYKDNSWTQISSFLHSWLSDICLLDENNGWAVGRHGSVKKLSNGTWTHNTSLPVERLLGVDFLNPNLGWAVGGTLEWTPGARGKIFKYSNGTWTLDGATDQCLWNISMVNPNLGFAVGENGKIMKYNGSTWINFSSPVSLPLYSIDMIDENHGSIVGADGTIIEYLGSTFNTVNNLTDKSLWCVSFSSISNGWAVGSQGTILRCHNGIWESFPSAPKILRGVRTMNDSIAYAVGMSGIYRFYNGSWNHLDHNSFKMSSNMYLNSVDFVNDTTGVIVGCVVSGGLGFNNITSQHSLIIKTSNGGGIPVGIPKTSINVDLKKLQIYPNPFDNYFIIENISFLPLTKIKMCNIYGQTVDLSQYPYTQEGNKIKIKVGNIAPGAYILKVVSGTSVQSVKIVKII